MPNKLQQQLASLTDVLSNHSTPETHDDLFRFIDAALRQALGDIRVLFYLENAPPHLTSQELLPCSARRLDKGLFVRDNRGWQQDFYIQYDRPHCVAIRAATHTFGLLFVDKVDLPLIEAEQTIVTLMAAQTAHHLHYIDRIENLNGQSGAEASSPIIDESCRQIRINGSTLPLKGKQWAALHLLYCHRGHTCSRQLMCQRLYANDRISGSGREARLDLLIHKLRQKLRQLQHNPLKIETVRGRGYRLTLKS